MLDGYFIPMAERVYGDAAIPKAERNAMTVIRHLKRLGPHHSTPGICGARLGDRCAKRPPWMPLVKSFSKPG